MTGLSGEVNRSVQTQSWAHSDVVHSVGSLCGDGAVWANSATEDTNKGWDGSWANAINGSHLPLRSLDCGRGREERGWEGSGAGKMKATASFDQAQSVRAPHGSFQPY